MQRRDTELVRMPDRATRGLRRKKGGATVFSHKTTVVPQSKRLETIGSLTGVVVHEYNNLLQAIRGYTKFVMDELTPEAPSYPDLQQVISATDRAVNLTRKLLSFTRHTQNEWQTLPPNELVRDVAHSLRPLMSDNIEIDLSLDEGAGCVEGDPTMLHQMLMNLCLNARDAMPDGGQLRISTADENLAEEHSASVGNILPGKYVRFTVADTGCGMPKDVADRIFEPFFTTKDLDGTGLGLAMVHAVVRQHRGAICLESAVGEGTRFHIYLPASNEPIRDSEPAVTSRPPNGNESILIADDEPLVCNVAARVLSGAGYRPYTALDGEQAIQVFEQHSDEIALAILDIAMPKKNGSQVCEELRRIRPDLPIVFCTGFDSNFAQPEFIDMDEYRIVEKPFDPEELLSTVRSGIDGISP